MEAIVDNYVSLYHLCDNPLVSAIKGLVSSPPSRKNNLEILEAFVAVHKNFFDINLDQGDFSWTPLVQAVWVGNYQMVSKLVELGADVCAPIYRNDYYSVFHRLVKTASVLSEDAEADSTEVVETLIGLIRLFVSKGVDPNGSQFRGFARITPDGQRIEGVPCPTPLSIACPKIADVLIELGATS